MLAWLVYLVIKRLSAKDMVLPTMLLFCCLSSLGKWLILTLNSFIIIGSAYYFVVLIYGDYHASEVPDVEPVPYKLTNGECATMVSGCLPSYFLTFAVVLNINKWIYFRYRI